MKRTMLFLFVLSMLMSLSLLAGNPTDVAVSNNGQFLYALVNRNNAIAAFAIKADGSLEPLPFLEGTPGNFAGLASY
ncbi:MAG: hypothetical protein H6631_17720 [Anaerolineaceae bacterium]|nr:hypothetical protein [Anaerolineaceae bacterium]MCB9102009.1 hypothetical protein [Anaerolineales bacterium]